MITTDKDVINFYNKYMMNHKKFNLNVFNESYIDYIYNKYIYINLDYKSILKQNLYRILNNIINIPCCPVCGKELKFDTNLNQYNKFCSKKCASIYHTPFRDIKAREKIKETCIKKYGVDNVFKLKETHKKSAQTKLERYGDTNYNNSNKFINTCLQKYGVKYPAQNKEIRSKQIKTSFDRYGGYFNKEQVSKTIKEKYGVDWFTQSEKILSINQSNEVKLKQQEAKRKNHTFNVSKPEDECYELLCSKFGTENIKRQHKTSLYPYCCDFYVSNIDLYIECNFHWTHGPHLYNKNNIKDIVLKCRWNQKAKKSKFYSNAIKTWTERDTEKQEIAKRNNLNYLVFYSMNEFMDWYNSL